MHAEKRLYDIRKTFVSDNQKCSILYKCIFLEPLKCRRAIKSKMLFWILFHSQKIIITVWCGLDWINGQINRWMWDSVQRDVDLLKSIDSDSSRSALDLHFLADSPAGSVSIYCTTAFFFILRGTFEKSFCIGHLKWANGSMGPADRQFTQIQFVHCQSNGFR